MPLLVSAGVTSHDTCAPCVTSHVGVDQHKQVCVCVWGGGGARGRRGGVRMRGCGCVCVWGGGGFVCEEQVGGVCIYVVTTALPWTRWPVPTTSSLNCTVSVQGLWQCQL